MSLHFSFFYPEIESWVSAEFLMTFNDITLTMYQLKQSSVNALKNIIFILPLTSTLPYFVHSKAPSQFNALDLN
jgi:hypothetical protein